MALRKIRVLLVEPNKPFQTLVPVILAGLGLEIVAVVSVEEAIAKLRNERFNLVISSWLETAPAVHNHLKNMDKPPLLIVFSVHPPIFLSETVKSWGATFADKAEALQLRDKVKSLLGLAAA